MMALDGPEAVDLKPAQDKAIACLTRREHSRVELRQKLSGLADSDGIEIVIEQLQQQNLQSDQRFAQMICRVRYRAGKGPVYIRHELEQHQIDSADIEQALAEYDGLWRELAQTVREKRFGIAPPDDYESWARQSRFLQQRGFSHAHIGRFESS